MISRRHLTQQTVWDMDPASTERVNKEEKENTTSITKPALKKQFFQN
jgi:hypothetical protein